MIRLVAFLLLTSPAAAQVVVPSGQAVETHSFEVVAQTEGKHLLFVGLVAPDLKADSYDSAAKDMDVLCTEVALPEAFTQARQGLAITEVSIRLADRPLAYGETDPQAVQFMSFYDISTGECTWH